MPAYAKPKNAAEVAALRNARGIDFPTAFGGGGGGGDGDVLFHRHRGLYGFRKHLVVVAPVRRVDVLNGVAILEDQA